MKKIFTLLIMCVFITSVFSQVPEKMSYQAVLRNPDGVLITNHEVGIQISILQGSVSGTPVYVETHSTTTNVNGLFTIEIGDGTAVSGDFSAIDWSAGTYFIKTETDPNGGTSYSITGTSQLLSVPYALYARTSENTIDAMTLTGDQVATGDKTFSGTTKVITPVNPTDAVNKSYVDMLKEQIQALEDNLISTGLFKLIDVEGNQYKVVKIGTQIWMAENLNTTKYSNGEPITSGVYTYNSDPATVETYGRLYDWHVATDSRNVCPTGWNVPGEDEWNTLLSNLASPAELKESGTTHWFSPNTGATNSVSFTALPGGYYHESVGTGLQAIATFYFKNETSATAGRGFWLYYNNTPTTGDYVSFEKDWAFSIRCLKSELTEKVTDIDGNVYNTVKIGDQVWMKENLRTTKYRNGDEIPNVTDNVAWSSLTTGAYCYYNNDAATYRETYGAWYNYYAVADNRHLCPTGWHVSTDADWKILEMNLGMTKEQADNTGFRGTTEGGKMKETGTVHWKTPNTGATNETGFTSLPSGHRYVDGSFISLGENGHFWNADSQTSVEAWHRTLEYDKSQIYRNWSAGMTNGMSVRCIKDN